VRLDESGLPDNAPPPARTDPLPTEPLPRGTNYRQTDYRTLARNKLNLGIQKLGPGNGGFALATVLVGVAAGLVTANRYKNAIQSDVAGNTGGTNTLGLLKSDIQNVAIARGISSLGPGASRVVGVAGGFFIAAEVGKLIFGEDDTLRADPLTGREIRWMKADDWSEANQCCWSPHVIDSWTGMWAEARDQSGPYLTQFEILMNNIKAQQLNDRGR
jgi:hypothetical protein